MYLFGTGHDKTRFARAGQGASAPPLTLICDKCQAQGRPGDPPFAGLGDLLDFEPIQHKIPRPDGWLPDVQRAYIAALACTGTDRQACRAVGKAPHGLNQLLAKPDAAPFIAARKRARAIHKERGTQRIMTSLNQVAAAEATWDNAAAQWQPARGRRTMPPPPPLSEAEENEIAEQSVDSIIRKYLLKLIAEREAREEGRIVAADFYLRQLTFIEVMLDVASEGRGMQKLAEARHHGLSLVQIAETDFSRFLDDARSRMWEECGDPPRPEHPPRRFLTEHDGYWLEAEPEANAAGGSTDRAREQARAERHKRDAEEQIRWEAEARRDHERRREATPPMDEEPGEAGRRAPHGDTSDVTNSLRDGPTTPTE